MLNVKDQVKLGRDLYKWCHIEGLCDLMKGSQTISAHFDVDGRMTYSEMDTNRKYGQKCGKMSFRSDFLFEIQFRLFQDFVHFLQIRFQTGQKGGYLRLK